MKTPVLCFDRDGVIDLSPPEDGDAVPISWIQFYAHYSEHHVWACGNQQLQIEAGIPTPYEANNILSRNGIDTNLSSAGGHKNAKDRIMIIDALYHNAYDNASFVVVSRRELPEFSDSINWTVISSNEFVQAVNSEILDIPEPNEDMVSGEPYYDTNKHGTYRQMLSNIEKSLRDHLRT